MNKVKLNVRRGGKAIPVNDNLYYMSGRKHSSGGIDIGDTLEVEGGEVIQTNSNNLKVFSAQPILNGISPAKLVLGGANPTEVFKKQEKFKDVNKINDDGTSKLACGGAKKKSNGGIVSVNGNVVNKLLGNIPFPSSTGDKKRATLGTKNTIKQYVSEKFNINTPLITNPMDMPIRKGKLPRRETTTKNATNNINSVKPTVAANKVITKHNTTPVAAKNPTAKLDSLNSLLVGLPTSAKRGLPTKLTAPEGIGQPKSTTRSSFLGDLNTYDLIGAGSNLIGTIASGINTNVNLNKMQAPEEPVYETAVPMKTNYNIKPQIGDINENVARTIEDVDANTSSSRVALQRKQRAMNAGQYSRNTLYGQKENIETQLINQDRLNRQQVSARNTALKNDWKNRNIQFNNLVREQKANSINRIFSGVNAGVQDMLTRIEARRNYNNTLGIYDATHPNVDKRLFTDKGVKF